MKALVKVILIVGLCFAATFVAIKATGTLTVEQIDGWLILAGLCGYGFGWRFVESVLGFLVRDIVERESAKTLFRQRGFVMILLARAVPILPEVTACLAGMTRMPFRRFIVAWSLSSALYVLIAAYAGSISSLENRQPAILTPIGISAALWTGCYVFRRRSLNRQAA